jgi:spermidine synthase
VFTFYEIDPLVERIARDQRLFTFLRDCPPAVEVIIGDARISLARQPRRSYDLIVLDAFSSDAIPVHLLTREAVELYLSNLAEGGLLLFHISNRYMDLSPVLARVAAKLKLVALDQLDFRVTPTQRDEGKTQSHWIVMARRRAVIAPLLTDPRWSLLDGAREAYLWTDDYSNILQVVSWR